MGHEIFLYIAIISGILFIALFIYLLRQTMRKRKETQQETQEYYVATTDADDED